jgi:hypothetical protein
MKQVAWLLILALVAGMAWGAWYAVRRYRAREQAAEARMAGFLAELKGSVAAPGPLAPAAPAPVAVAAAPENVTGLAQQKLLFEAAAKAGDAGEPALSIQLYARLLARYPDCAFAGPAKSAVEAQKRKLAKG